LTSSQAKGSKDRNVAALLTWFVPGAGHLYLGKAQRALVFFVLIEGLYYLGLKLNQGMTFQYLAPELRSMLAPVLSPEVGNLGGFLWQLRHYAYGHGLVEIWPRGMVAGTLLCASSGVLNALLMVQAHCEASEEKATAAGGPSPAQAACLAWIFPGLAHWKQGRRTRSATIALMLIGLFLFGTLLAEGSNLSRERHFYYWSGQFLLGLPAIVGELLGSDLRVECQIPYGEAGLVFGCVAGLLNVLAMIDAYAYSEARSFQCGESQPARSGA
jgi:hypothetical protein